MKWNRILTLVIAFCIWQTASGQKSDKSSDKTITITGKVFNKDQKPVEGAVFYLDNVKTSYITNSKGSYKIKVSSSAANLEVRSPEFGSAEIAINGQKKIDFTLNENSENEKFNAVDAEKENGSAKSGTKPAQKKVKKMNTYNNIFQMIRMEVPGVRVDGNSIQIQQAHSFFGSGEPLYVVNGVIVPSIDNVNPMEVKSIRVLIGSSATIYGVRGSNGVISITLLNGSEKEK